MVKLTLKDALDQYSNYMVNKMAADAQYRGDFGAAIIIGRINNRLAQTANRRLKALEKHGYTGNAYQFVRGFVNIANNKKSSPQENPKIRFSLLGGEGDDEDFTYKEMARQIDYMRAFLRMQTSTIAGNKAIEKKRFDTFRNNAKFNDVFGFWSDRKLRKFLKFLGKNNVGDFTQNTPDQSEDLVEMLAGAYKEVGLNQLEELIDIWQSYENGTAKDNDRLYYDELVNMLKNPETIKPYIEGRG